MPEGWHVPTEEELTILTDHFGGASVAGGKLKEAGLAHWIEPNEGATNEVVLRLFRVATVIRGVHLVALGGTVSG